MKKVIFLLALTGLCISCNESTPSGGRNSYINSYFIADGISSIYLISKNNRTFTVELSGEMVSSRGTSHNPDKFWELAEKYGDVSYNTRALPPNWFQALANEITTINIVSDADYDNLHPAGTPLDDIVNLSGESFYSFVKSGYDENGRHFFDKPLNELTLDDLKLLEVLNNGENTALLSSGRSGNGWFRFSTAPTKSQVHTITLTITDVDGNVFSATKLIDFGDSSMWVQ